MLSFENATANIHPDAIPPGGFDPEQPPPPPLDPVDRFWAWADSDLLNDTTSFGVSLANLVNHVRTFWDRRNEPQVALFHYADLKADLPGELRRLARLLSIEISDERVDELVAAATFDRMRGRADELAPGVDHKLWRSNENFFRSGTSGQWRSLLDSAALDRYRSRVAELAPPELVEWLHRP